MVTKAMKQGLGLACVLAVLTGCSSTATQDDAATSPADASPVSTQPAVSEGLNTSEPQEPVEAALDTVVYFEFDQSILTADSRALLSAHAERLKSSPRALRLEGHADERGTREYNMALGERRANAVRDFLVLQGVDRAALESVSYGEERPAVLGSNERTWQQNRRVELK